ncbi:MAG: ATP-binding protein [Pyrinomonadaceae bacterium]
MVVANELSELKRVSNRVNQWAQQHRVEDGLSSRLDLCSTEVVTNVISYAYDDNAEHAIVLRLCRDNDLISLTVEDDGKPFDPLQVQTKAPITGPEDVRITGWGILLVRRFFDAASYRRADGKNYLTLNFRC